MQDGPIVSTNRYLFNLDHFPRIDRGDDPARPVVRLERAHGDPVTVNGSDALELQAELSKLFPRPAPPADATAGAAADASSAPQTAAVATAAEIPPAVQPAANGPSAGQGAAPGAAPTAQAPPAKAAPVLT